jgi:hypothetical protein
MNDPTPIPPLPLVNVRDLLKAAHKILTHERMTVTDEQTGKELDAVLNDLMALLLRLKAVGSDSAWGAD